MPTTNLKKHLTKNPLKRYFIERFYKNLFLIIRPLFLNRILDVGCGEGFTLKRIKKIKLANQLIGIDNSNRALRLGKKHNPKLNLIKGNIYHLPFKDNDFDLILCLEVLEHLKNPKKALDELVRVSKKYVLFSVPREPLFALSGAIRTMKTTSRFNQEVGHIQHWHPKNFSSFIAQKLIIRKKRFSFPWMIILAEKR